jgi:hypothetical protein
VSSYSALTDSNPGATVPSTLIFTLGSLLILLPR